MDHARLPGAWLTLPEAWGRDVGRHTGVAAARRDSACGETCIGAIFMAAGDHVLTFEVYFGKRRAAPSIEHRAIADHDLQRDRHQYKGGNAARPSAKWGPIAFHVLAYLTRGEPDTECSEEDKEHDETRGDTQ